MRTPLFLLSCAAAIVGAGASLSADRVRLRSGQTIGTSRRVGLMKQQ
jgi:hypothetical protein